MPSMDPEWARARAKGVGVGVEGEGEGEGEGEIGVHMPGSGVAILPSKLIVAEGVGQ
jgi:hypothetical protein